MTGGTAKALLALAKDSLAEMVQILRLYDSGMYTPEEYDSICTGENIANIIARLMNKPETIITEDNPK